MDRSQRLVGAHVLTRACDKVAGQRVMRGWEEVERGRIAERKFYEKIDGC